ncbi:MAG: response regulator [Bdellovibrio sp.]|nr:MAG: response regulator [Bdellovibrio sp.]
MFPPETKILIVDDMKTMRKIVMKALKNMGYSNFIEAENGNIAWAKLNEEKDIGLIISDWNMPECTGLNFLKMVRSSSDFKNTPFVLVTAESEMSQVQEAVQAGVDNYIVKPFSAQSLQEKLMAVYKKRLAAA